MKLSWLLECYKILVIRNYSIHLGDALGRQSMTRPASLAVVVYIMEKNYQKDVLNDI